MLRSELIHRIAEENQLPNGVAADLVDSFFTTISKRLAAGGRVELRGFGTFELRTFKARDTRNPRTGEIIAKPATRLPLFRMSKLLLSRLDPAVPRRKHTD